jgi:phospholipid/cholesterol/gamma-HCH transport system substrate-binding protein
MKKKKGNTIRLGIFVTLGVVLFVIGIYYIGNKRQLFSRTFRVSGVFRDVSGLQAGNNVRFGGINVGIVENIDIINDSSVRVEMFIDEDTRRFIKTDAVASIGSDGLMGNKIVIIAPGAGNAPAIQDKGVIKTSVPIGIDDILQKVQVTTNNVAKMSDDLSVITSNIRNGKGAIGKLFMDSVFAENIDQALVNVKEGAGAFNQNMDAAKHSFLLRGVFKKRAEKAKEKKEKSSDGK